MMRPLLCAPLMVLALLAGCSDQSSQHAVSTPSKHPGGKSTTPASTTPASTAVEPVSPTQEVVFQDLQSCQAAGYTTKQCASASGVSESMSRALPAVYSTARECAMYFQECVHRKNSTAEQGFLPRMKGFSMGNEKPGLEVSPSPTTPLFYAPVFKDTSGHWVYILVDEHNNLLAMPVKPKPVKPKPVKPKPIQTQGHAKSPVPPQAH